MNSFVFIAGMVGGTFVAELIKTDPNWAIAFERSFFQATAVLAYILFMKYYK